MKNINLSLKKKIKSPLNIIIMTFKPKGENI